MYNFGHGVISASCSENLICMPDIQISISYRFISTRGRNYKYLSTLQNVSKRGKTWLKHDQTWHGHFFKYVKNSRAFSHVLPRFWIVTIDVGAKIWHYDSTSSKTECCHQNFKSFLLTNIIIIGIQSELGTPAYKHTQVQLRR